MNPTQHPHAPRAAKPQAAATALAATIVLNALLATSARADMYHPSTNSEGGVPAQSTITSITPQGTNTTVCWYGMQGWYTVEMSTNGGAAPWTPVGRTAASDHAWCLSVTNGGFPSAQFRLNQNNAYAGTGACAGCHGDKHSEWVGTAHAHAAADLEATITAIGLPPVVAEGCRVCHNVGKGQPSGFVDAASTPHLQDVGCETCHGPAAWHKYSDHDLIRPAVSIDPKICGGCHTDSHHPTFDEYEESPHAEVNDDVKYGFANGAYFTNLIYVTWGTNSVPQGTPGSSNCYGFYITTNANLTLKTNFTTGIIHSGNGPGTPYVYDPGQDRAVGCGICHSAATRMAQLEDYEARLSGVTNALVFPEAHDSAEWSATCATCHDPHSDYNPAQLRYPTRSTNYYTMPTTSDKRTILSTNFQGGVTKSVQFYSAAFANMYDPNIQVCAQCHNSRGARWDGRSFGYYDILTTNSVTTNGPGIAWGVQTNVSFSRPPHHSPQYNVLIGIVQSDYLTTDSSGVATNWAHRHGTSRSSSSGVYNTNQCATCHVPSYAVNANTNVTGHTFEMDTKNCTLSGCHGSVPNYEETKVSTTNSLSRVVALLNQWATNKGPTLFSTADYNRSKENCWEYSTIGALASATTPGPRDTNQIKLPDAIKQARFNLYMVLHDGSLGVHNPTFASGLINDASTKVLSQFQLANFSANKTVGWTNLAVTFTSLGTGVTNWNWNFGDGNTSTDANPTYTYTNAGIYSVNLTTIGTNGTESLTRPSYIGVYVKPAPAFDASPRTGTAPLQVYFTNLTANAQNVTAWRWTFMGGVSGSPTSSEVNPVFTYTNAGTYNVYLRTTDPTGNSGRITVTNNAFITVTAAP